MTMETTICFDSLFGILSRTLCPASGTPHLRGEKQQMPLMRNLTFLATLTFTHFFTIYKCFEIITLHLEVRGN